MSWFNDYNNYYLKEDKTGWTRILTRGEAFAKVLREHPPRRSRKPGDIVILEVRFGLSANTYCYISKDDIYSPGDLVEVKVQGQSKVVTVESVGYYSEKEYPFKDLHLNTIVGPAKGTLAEQYRKAIDEEQNRIDDEEEVRREARKLLEEARRMKNDASKERAEAEDMKSAAAKERAGAESMKSDAAKERAEAEEMMAEARVKLEEANKAMAEARKATEETEAAGLAARRENERLEQAKKEAAKVWKRERPETSNKIILDLRSVQDDLDEDEDIYKGLSALENKITKVMNKADQMKAEEGDSAPSDIDKLYDYYLPKTIKVLEQYRNIFSSGLPPRSVESLKNDVLDAIKTSTDVYDNILQILFKSDILDLYSEMKALQTMFGMQGLLGSDFDVE